MTKAIAVAFLILSIPSLVVAQATLDQRVGELSQQISKEMTDNQKKTIAVIEFVDLKGNVTDFGRFLAEELITRLYQTKKFKVIERQLLNRVIAEQKLSLTSAVDPSSARQLGKLLGVDAICSGTISDLTKSFKVNGRLISTETGEIFAVASTEIAKDDSVAGLIGTAASGSGASPPNSFPVTLPKPKLPSLETESYRVTIDAVRKVGNSVSITMFFESTSDYKIQLGWRSFEDEIYLLDENGEKWVLQERDSGGIVVPLGYGPVDLLPGTRIKSKFTFAAKADSAGTVFTLAALEREPMNRQVLVKGIKAQ